MRSIKRSIKIQLCTQVTYQQLIIMVYLLYKIKEVDNLLLMRKGPIMFTKYDEKWSKQPMLLSGTRVWRTYTGGRMIDEFMGNDDPSDGHFPEEWIASVVQAFNPGREQIVEGLNRLQFGDETGPTLKECIENDPVAWLGQKHVAEFKNTTGFLIKFIDSSERLTIQVHPTKQKAKELFNSLFGKTEVWYILGGRSIDGVEPCVYHGFKSNVSRDRFKRLFDVQDISGMLDCLNKVPVNPGQVILMPGGLPHAIGAGCFLLELQEPTDYTIRVERVTPGGLKVPDELCHQGIGFEKMFDCFSFTDDTPHKPDDYVLTPETVRDDENGIEQIRVSYTDTPFFSMRTFKINKSMRISQHGGFSVIVVLAGSGTINRGGDELSIKQGQQLFLPAGLSEIVCSSNGAAPVELVQCLPAKL